jgi:peptidylprolyl isomerase
MANRGSPQSAQGQFFIVHADSRKLDGKYTIFGRVLEGIDVIDSVTELEIDTYGRFGPPDRPYPVDARIASLRVAGP